jgi:anaerobic ribonucleoside-triphosphate reductase activating protein
MLKRTNTLGPGDRFALWLQGCEKSCPKCMSPTSRDINGGTLVSVDGLVQTVLSEIDLEGITISGGEPFLQFSSLKDFLQQLRGKSSLGIIIYTGYYLKELYEQNNPEINEIIDSLSDIIIDGPYIDDLNDGKSLRGSSNQTVHWTSKRYADIADLVYNQPERKCEIRFNNKEAFLAGIPDANGYKMWLDIFESNGCNKHFANSSNMNKIDSYGG